LSKETLAFTPIGMPLAFLKVIFIVWRWLEIQFL